MPPETVSVASETGLSTRLRSHILPFWQSHLHHPFVAALGDGSLPQANFAFYIRQDAIFLDTLARTFAYAVTKTNDAAEMLRFGQLLLNTLQVEEHLHRGYAERFGISPAEMAATPMTPTNYAYTRHLLAVAATGTLPELITAILPCAWIYTEVGHQFARTAPSTPAHPYHDWLSLYASPDFEATGVWLRERLDAHTQGISPQAEAGLHAIFLTSTRYEWLFWEMAWRLEEWPA
jgi:thiaminase/transcriptional activator TenA